MKYLIFECMTKSGKLADVKLTEQEAIKLQRNSVWLKEGYIYETDQFALKDFIIAHRAFWREE